MLGRVVNPGVRVREESQSQAVSLRAAAEGAEQSGESGNITDRVHQIRSDDPGVVM